MRLEKFKESAKNAKLKFCRESCVNGKKFTDNIIYKMYTHKPQIVKKKILHLLKYLYLCLILMLG